MILWIILAVMTAVAVLVVLVPLIRPGKNVEEGEASDVAVYKDQLDEIKSDFDRGLLPESEAEAARAEIARRLLKAADASGANASLEANKVGLVRKFTTVVAIVFIPGISMGYYLLTGSPDLPGQPFAERAPVQSSTTVAEKDATQQLIARAEAHLAENPDDIRGWEILAPIYTRLRRFSDATFALKRVMDLSGGAPKATADYGESLIIANRGDVTPQAVTVFRNLLKTNPKMPRPLHYIALADAQVGRLKEAAVKWRSLLAENAKDVPWRADIERLAAKAEAESGSAPKTVVSSATSANSGQVTPQGGQLPALSDEQMKAGNSMGAGARQQMIAGMVKRLSDRLAENGGPVEDWIKLARTRQVLGQTDAAKAALATAETAYADQPQALVQLNNARAQMGFERVANISDGNAAVPQTAKPSPAPSLPEGSRPPALSQEQMNAGGAMDANSRQAMIASMVKRLSDRLAQDGGSVGEWIRLARAYTVMGNNDQAKAALASAEVAYAVKPESLEQLKNARTQLGIEP